MHSERKLQTIPDQKFFPFRTKPSSCAYVFILPFFFPVLLGHCRRNPEPSGYSQNPNPTLALKRIAPDQNQPQRPTGRPALAPSVSEEEFHGKNAAHRLIRPAP